MSVLELRPRRELRRRAGLEDATRRLLQYAVVPLWIGAGLADWTCHRRTRIEQTSGVEESAIHLLMMSEAGVPAALGLFLEVNAFALAATLGAFALHQATAVWDVAYADGRRRVTPTEQHVHGLLEQVPAMATAFLVALHWDQAAALLGRRGERPRLRPERKRRPPSPRYRTGFLAAVTGLVAIPYLEELWRCARNVPSAEAPSPSSDRTEARR